MKGGAHYPDAFGAFLSIINIFTSLDFMEVVHVDCFRNLDYVDSLLGTTLLPTAMAVCVGLTELFFYVTGLKRPPVMKNRPLVKLLLMLLFFFLPAISRVVTSFEGIQVGKYTQIFTSVLFFLLLLPS